LWFGVDDVFTGPVDEILVIGGLYAWWQANQSHDENGEMDNGLSPADEYAANSAEVHRWCDEPEPPYFLNDCDRWKWKYNKAKRCIAAREEHNRRWFGGQYDKSHADHMAQLGNELATAKRNMELFCGKKNCEY
jgi:hypothetical protein